MGSCPTLASVVHMLKTQNSKSQKPKQATLLNPNSKTPLKQPYALHPVFYCDPFRLLAKESLGRRPCVALPALLPGSKGAGYNGYGMRTDLARQGSHALLQIRNFVNCRRLQIRTATSIIIVSSTSVIIVVLAVTISIATVK